MRLAVILGWALMLLMLLGTVLAQDNSTNQTNENNSTNTTTQNDTANNSSNNNQSSQGNEVTICHFPPGNPANRQTISVNSNALSAHLAHGDTIGACPMATNTTTNTTNTTIPTNNQTNVTINTTTINSTQNNQSNNNQNNSGNGIDVTNQKFNQVVLRCDVPNATRYDWDFGDGQTMRGIFNHD